MFILSLLLALPTFFQEPQPSQNIIGKVELDHYIQSGIEALKQKNYSQALEWIDRALPQQSTNAELYRLKAQILEMMEEYKEALKAWETCSRLARDIKLKQEAALHIKRLKI